MKRTAPSSAGFSLLEVMVALTVFAIAASGILTALGNHLRQVSYVQDQAKALRLAAREMDALRRMSPFEAGEVSGTEDRFTWTATADAEGLDDWPGLADAPGIPARLRVVVSWSDEADGPTNGVVRLDGFAHYAEVL